MRARTRPLAQHIRGAVFLLYVVLLFGPFVAIFILAFHTPHGGLTFPIQGASLAWFSDLVHPQQLIDFRPAIARSLALSAMATVLTVVISVLAGLAFRRGFFGQTVVLYVVATSLIVPSVLVSIGLGLIFQILRIPLSWWSAGLGAVLTWTLPFGVFIMFSVFSRLDPSYEEAARDLGARRSQPFRWVALPIVLPAVLGVALMSFTLAYDEFPRSSMVTGATNTLPLELVAFMTIRGTPAIYALGTVTTVISLILVAIVLFFMLRLQSRRRLAGR
jgi:putative spermidine/putrescine transport system permease protein